MVTYSGKRGQSDLMKEVTEAIKRAGSFGSVEIYIQNHTITQITARSIQKTSHNLKNIA